MHPAIPGRVDGIRDATPFLRTETGYLWHSCESELDRIAAAFRQAAAKHGLAVFVRRSLPGTWPGWVSFEAWMPGRDPRMTARFRAEVKLTPLPHHRLRLQVETSLYDRGINRWTTPRQLEPGDIRHPDMLGDAAIDQLVAYAAGASRVRPPLFRWMPLTALFQRNEIPILSTSNAQKVGLAMLIGGWMILSAASLIGAVITALGGLIMACDWLIRINISDRRILVIDCGRPVSIPRSLMFLDTWYALVRGIGREAAACREGLLERLRSSCPEEASVGVETVDYRVLDGLVAREQIVVRFRRAVVFCHVYAYEEDLYVGWDAHLDCGDWKEADVAEGYSSTCGVNVRLTTVQSSRTLPTTYHLADANGITEWLHRQVRDHVKLLLTERAIDQEIDFTIIRGQRGDTLDRRLGRDDGHKQETPDWQRRARVWRVA